MKRNITLFYSFFLIASIFLLLSGSERRSKIAINISGWLIYPLKITLKNLEELQNVKEKNQYLGKRLAELTIELDRLRVYKIENEHLKSILGFNIETKKFLDPLQVLNIYEIGGNQIIACKKKTYNIIKKNAIVVGYNGLIGRVKDISKDFIIVHTIKNTVNRITVIDQRSGIFGILGYKGYFFIDGISINDDIRSGDTIITAGVGGIYPNGLKIGVITDIKKTVRDYEAKITLTPFENLKFYNEVFAITK